MNDAQPWTASQFERETARYFEGTEHEEFERAKETYTKAWNARNQDPEKAKKLFQEAANLFKKCKMPGLSQKAKSYS